MTQSHRGEILSLNKQLIPISKNTTFHASYDNDLNGFNQGRKINPFGYTTSLKFSMAKGDYGVMNVQNLPSGAATRTLECWVYPTNSSLGGSPAMIGYPLSGTQSGLSNAIFEINYSISGNSKFGIHLWGNVVYSINTFAINAWYHVAATYDGTNVKLYVNGNLENTVAIPLNTFVNPGSYNFNLRNSVNPSDGALPGSISDVRVWNYERTQQQIKDGMNTEFTGSESGLLAYWKLNEGQGATIYDSANGNDGLIQGTTWSEGRTVASLRHDGKFGKAVAIEQAVTNLWGAGDYAVYNNFGVPSSITPTGEYYLGQPVYRLAMTVDNAHSNALPSFQTDLFSHGVYGGGLTWLNGVSYVSSIYWKPINKMDTVFGGVASNISGWNPGTNTALPNGWRRYYRWRTGVGVPDVGDVVHHSFYCPSLQLNETIYIDFCCAQTEQGRTFPTSYVNGSRGDGKLLYPHPLYGADQGTINFWAYFPSSTSTGTSQVWFWDYNGTLVSPWIGLTGGMSLNPFGVDGIGYAGSWNMYTGVKRSNSMVDWYINGVKVNSIAPNAEGMFKSDNIITLGNYGINGFPSNVLIDELKFDNVAVTDDEVLAWYKSDAPFYNYLDYTEVAY